mgnify:CR=1 FL=1
MHQLVLAATVVTVPLAFALGEWAVGRLMPRRDRGRSGGTSTRTARPRFE